MSSTPPELDIDLSLLNEIANGDKEFIAESIEMFMVQAPELLETINTAILDKNWEAITAAAHKLKPNLGFFGMPISEQLSHEVELIAKQEAPEPELLTIKVNELTRILSKNLFFLSKIKEKK